MSCNADLLLASLKNFNFFTVLSRAIPQILVADYVWPANLNTSSEVGVDESLDSFHSGTFQDNGSICGRLDLQDFTVPSTDLSAQTC